MQRSGSKTQGATKLARWVMALLLLLLAAPPFLPLSGVGVAQDANPAPPADPPEPAGPRRAALIELSGEIDPILEQFIYRALEKARKQEVQVVILEIDSPGGLVQSSFDLADTLRTLDWAETVAYIPRDALSGASIVALGCEKIVLHPEANFGDAGIIRPEADGAFHYVPEKVQSYLSRRLRQLAESRQRPGALAEALMNSKLKVLELRHRETHAIQYAAERDLEGLEDGEMWQRVRPVVETGDDRFLTLSGKRTVELQMAEGLASNQEELLQLLNVADPFVAYRPGTLETTIRFLNHPLITGLLFVVGLVALYLEFSAPGVGVGGAVCGLCFAVFFWSRFLSGTAGALEVILFVAGIAFLLLELFVIPGFGIAGLLGLGLIAVSLLLASQNFIVPETAQEREKLAISLVVLTGSGLFVLGSVVVLARQFGRIPVLNRLVLAPMADGDAAPARDESDGVVKTGDFGMSESPLRPAGKALFGDSYVNVVADGSFIDAGRPIKVVDVSGYRIVVREIEEKPVPAPPSG